MIAQADAVRLPLLSASCDLVMGSPPYQNARTYLENGRDLGIARKCREWVSWMLEVTAEALRVSRGLVLWVVAGKTDDWCYQPGPEGLLWEWWKQGGECHLFRPCYWHRVGIPGSGGEQWYRADVEYVLAFKRPGRLPWSDNTANGTAPKFAPAGRVSYREADGKRVHLKQFAEESRDQNYTPPDLANPGNLLSITVGGGHLGSSLAHLNEAPYPQRLPEWFIASHVPTGGLVCDPFSGSGTTAAAAVKLGRRCVTMDLRMSQCRLSRRRLAGVTPGFAFAEEPSPCR